jgi:hypothetical protein
MPSKPPRLQRFRVTFIFHNDKGQLRTKEREEYGFSMNDAVEKVKRIFGKITVIKIERL